MPNGDLTYDQLARTGHHRWWTPLVTLPAAAFVGAIVGIGTVVLSMVVVAVSGGKVSLEGETTFSPIVESIMLILVIATLTPTALIVCRLVQRRPMGTLHSVEYRLRWRSMLIFLPIALLSAVVLLSTLLLISDVDEPLLLIGWPEFLGLAAVLTVVVPLQAAGEEYLFRGLILQTLAIYHRWVGILGSSLLFALLHGWGTWSGFLALFAGAILWACLVIRTGGLEVSITAHAVTNLLAFLAEAAAGELGDTTTSLADSPLSISLLVVASDAGYAAAVVLVLFYLHRRHPRWVPSRRTPAKPDPSLENGLIHELHP